jgi:TetR/AcrR family transcriptional repressor of nem operon
VGHSRVDKAKSRQRILDVAAVQIRDFGLEGVSIGELMKSAKLTHGGFYGHFSSRDDLIAEALDKALKDGAASGARAGSGKGPPTLKSFLHSYLSRAHRDDPRAGCAISALAGDVARADRRTREIMTKHVAEHFDIIGKLIGEDDVADFSVSVLCTIVGAVMLSRAISDEETSNKVLLAARKTILDYAETRTTS